MPAIRNIAIRLLIIAGTATLFISAWYLLSTIPQTQSALPSPLRVAQVGVEMWQSGELGQDIAASLKRVATGFALALGAGLALGILAARYIKTYSTLSVFLELLSSIPPIAWTPLAILWFGIGDAPAYFIVFLGAFFPLFTGVYAGVTRTEKTFIDAALTLGASRTRTVFGVILPSAMPSILTGIKTGVGVAWFNVIAAELIGVRSGLGYKIQLSRTLLFSENVIALMLVIGVIGWVMVKIVALGGNLMAPWMIENESRSKWISRRLLLGDLWRRVFPAGKRQMAGTTVVSKPLIVSDVSLGQPLLEVLNISKTFPLQGRERLQVLRDIGFTVDRGEVFTIIGPNGCGKSTIVRLVAGLLQPDSGVVRFQGRPVTAPGRGAPVIFQDFALFPWYTAKGNIQFALDSSSSTQDRDAETAALLHQAGLTQFGRAYPADLSGGMRQKLALVRGLAVRPDLILMDEPFASLDPLVREKSQESILFVLASRPATVLLVTHDLDEAIFMSTHILVLSPRPGQMKRLVTVDLPKKRNAETRKMPEFHAMRSELLGLLRAPMSEDQ